MGRMALFVVLGVPLVAFRWETLNVLLSGIVVGWRLLVAIPVLAVFGGLLVVLGRGVWRWYGPASRAQ